MGRKQKTSWETSRTYQPASPVLGEGWGWGKSEGNITFKLTREALSSSAFFKHTK